NNFDTAIAVSNGTNARFFDHVNTGTPTARFFVQDKLGHINGEFVLTDTTGNQIHFFDFTGAPYSEPRWGKFKSMVDPEGNLTTLTGWTGDGRPTEVQRSTPLGQTPRVIESYLFSYVSTGVNQGLTAGVTLRRQVDGGTWTTVRSVDYAYYDSGEANGN